VKEVLETNKLKHPFILALGTYSQLNMASFFVIIDKLSVPCENNFLCALDLCYKAFIVLGLSFPIECKPYWQYIDHVIFERVETPDLLPPTVKFLVGQTAWRLLDCKQ